MMLAHRVGQKVSLVVVNMVWSAGATGEQGDRPSYFRNAVIIGIGGQRLRWVSIPPVLGVKDSCWVGYDMVYGAQNGGSEV